MGTRRGGFFLLVLSMVRLTVTVQSYKYTTFIFAWVSAKPLSIAKTSVVLKKLGPPAPFESSLLRVINVFTAQRIKDKTLQQDVLLITVFNPRK